MTLLRSRATGNVLVLGLLSLWFVTLAPVAIKGPAAYIEVVGHSMDGTYRTGDLVVTRAQETYEKGDIVAFRLGQDEASGQVIHRIIGGNGERGYRLQGDNNPDPDPWRPTDADVIGKAWIHLDQKAYLLHLPRNPAFAGVAAGLVTLLVLGLDAMPRRRRSEDTEDADLGLLAPETAHEPALALVPGAGSEAAGEGDADTSGLPAQRRPEHDVPAEQPGRTS